MYITRKISSRAGPTRRPAIYFIPQSPLVTGCIHRSAVEAFLVPYAAIVLLWPFSPGIRLVFPIIPWMVFLALSGLRPLTAQIALRHLATAVSAFLRLIAVPYTNAYRHTDFGPIRQSAGLPEFHELC